MLFAAYADVGGGICFLFFLVLVAGSVLLWLLYWSRHGFRAASRRPGVYRVGASLIAILLLFVSMAFPPMRRTADWSDKETGQSIPAEWQTEFDRFLFGYIPSYGWIGSTGQQLPYSCEVTIQGRGPYRCESYMWIIDWLFLTGQLVVFVVLLLPFLLTKSCPNST